jgi:hypothetical protein
MTAIRPLAPATALDPYSRSPVAFVLGLVAFISGFTVIVAGAVLPDLTSHPFAVLTTAANQAATASIAVRQDAVRVTEDPHLLPASSDLGSAARQAGPIRTQTHRNAEQIAPVRLGLDIRGGVSRPSPCLKSDLERGTRAESAHLATIPLQRDPREALITLAAEQHGGPGSWSGSCLMRRLTVQDPGQADSDDRIANALVAPAPVASPQRLTGPR